MEYLEIPQKVMKIKKLSQNSPKLKRYDHFKFQVLKSDKSVKIRSILALILVIFCSKSAQIYYFN